MAADRARNPRSPRGVEGGAVRAETLRHGHPPLTPQGGAVPVVTLSGWGFLGAEVAVRYGRWALYGSGSRVESLDALPGQTGTPAAAPGVPPVSHGASAAAALGRVVLEPRMNPLRAVLRAGHAPVGSTRFRYEIAPVDPAGQRSWMKAGALGSRNDV